MEGTERVKSYFPRKHARTAEIIPHPAWRHRIAKERLQHVADIRSSFDRHRLLADVVRQHRRHLESIGVAADRTEADVAALEAAFEANEKPLRRRPA